MESIEIATGKNHHHKIGIMLALRGMPVITETLLYNIATSTCKIKIYIAICIARPSYILYSYTYILAIAIRMRSYSSCQNKGILN